MCRCCEPFLATIRRRFPEVVFRVTPSRLFLIIILIASAAWAQDASTGALRGVVLDAQGAAITEADIVAIRVETGVRYHSATDSVGRFVMDLLPPGKYSARAEAEGMSPQISPVMQVEVGAATQLTFELRVAGPKEMISVSEAPRILEANPSSVSALVDERAVKDLPLNGRRYTDLLLLAPGVTQDPRGLTSGSNGDLSYGGIRGYNTSFLVDGGDNNNGFFGQALGRYRAPYQFSDEVIQEFRVQSSGYGAESGRAGGAVVNVVTKSGTNQWHGSTFYYLRDSSLGGAAPPFVGFNPSNQQHQFGATLGGPIQRDKMFVLVSLDQHIFHVPTVVEFENGSTVAVPQLGTPSNPGDYEVCDPAVGGQACDQTLVFASAAQLSTMGGTFHAKLLGNAGFVKLDRVLTPRQHLSARLSTSRYYGANNVFFDPSSPITNYAISGNGQEQVRTESASLNLLSEITPRLTSHLRAQFSRDLQQSFPNSTGVRTRIYSWLLDFGQSSILPRETREHRLHLAETFSRSRGRHELKFGGDTMLTWDYNYFPSLYGGEYLYSTIVVDPFTFEPMHGGLSLTPLRAWAHDVPRYYIQNFGNPVSHPNSNDYAGFVQDTVRLTPHFTLSLGARYDRQTFSKTGMVSNSLWPAAGKMPSPETNFAPRVGIGYALGNDRPLMVRAGFGLFFTRIPQIYQSSVMNNNGVNNNFLYLDRTDQNQALVFPTYPYPAVNCPRGPVSCTLPDSLKQYATNDISAFSPDFRTPRVQQGSLSLEQELVGGFTGTLSYLYVHGVDMLRARDVNLPLPTDYSYPIYDSSGNNFQNAFYNVQSFATWQTTSSISCPFPPCISPVARPISQLGAIDQFEGAASSVYHGMTVSLRKQVSGGLYFRLAYTWAHAIDNVQDAVSAGSPATVQNSYSTKSERASSVTDQRQRLAISATDEFNPFAAQQKFLAATFNHWKVSGIMTYGSGRPANATVSGDPNQDGNTSNDRLPKYGRNAFLGPDYASMDMRVGRQINLGGRYHLELTAESFNLFNRDNKRYGVADDGFYNAGGQFVKYSQKAGGTYYPAYYQQPTSFMKTTSAFAPRQMQFSMRLNF
jgi:Carboxypeptidase regulatory-like domain/TonB dependent receptor